MVITAAHLSPDALDCFWSLDLDRATLSELIWWRFTSSWQGLLGLRYSAIAASVHVDGLRGLRVIAKPWRPCFHSGGGTESITIWHFHLRQTLGVMTSSSWNNVVFVEQKGSQRVYLIGAQRPLLIERHAAVDVSHIVAPNGERSAMIPGGPISIPAIVPGAGFGGTPWRLIN